MSGYALFLLSVGTAAAALWTVRRDRFLSFAILLTYAVWHTPLILTGLFPYDLPIRSIANRPYVIALVALIHVIVWSGVLGYLSARKWARPESGPAPFRPHWTFVVAAYTGALCFAIDAFAFRTDFSLDIGANRSTYSNVDSASIFGHAGILLGGIALILLLARPMTPRTFARYGGPYALYSATNLLVGNRQFMLLGIILLVLTFLAGRRPPVIRTVIAGSIIGILFFVLMVAFGSARQSATKGVQDVALASLMRIEVLDYDHPLTRNYAMRTASLYLFIYYGIEYEMAGSIMREVEYRAPFLSLTVPIVYRRISGPAGLLDQGTVMRRAAEHVEATLGVYPNVWATMFTQAYYEGGRKGVVFFAVLLALLNFLFTRRMVKLRTNGATAALTVFHAALIFGIMFAPTREGSFASMLIVGTGFALLRVSARMTPRDSPTPAPDRHAARGAV